MGLFRRANKLLRLGSGLRNCCCRPENPLVCFCPVDWCRYYWQHDAGVIFPALTLRYRFSEYCGDPHFERFSFDSRSFATQEEQDNAPAITSFGALSNVSMRGRASGSASLFGAYAFQNYYLAGRPSEAALSLFFSVTGTTQSDYTPDEGFFGEYQAEADLEVKCDETVLPRTLNATAKIRAKVTIGHRSGSGDRATERFISYTQVQECSVDLAPYASCQENGNFFCGRVLLSPYIHFDEDVQFSFSESGLDINGTNNAWQVDESFLSDLFVVTPAEIPSVLLTEDFPLYPTYTLKGLASCRTAPCDCTESLTGSTVTFEGKTFTYGSLESFTEGVTTWEETSAGIFRRIDRETCDGTYVAYVRQAEVACDTSGAEDLWIVYLDAECYERDEATCPAAAEGRRDMGWTGVFTCGEDGKPTGSPHSATDDTAPPDEDYNTTGPAPTAECAADLAIPSISFG